MISLGIIEDLPAIYHTLESWWTGHGWQAVPEQILPRLGILASDGERPLAAGFLYMDNSVGVAMLEWLVTDPEAPARKAAVALSRLVDFAKQEAKALDYSVILTTCRQESLVRLMEKNGFTTTDKEMTHLLAVL